MGLRRAAGCRRSSCRPIRRGPRACGRGGCSAAKQRCLARPIWPEQPLHLALLHDQAGAVEGTGGLEALDQATSTDRRHGATRYALRVSISWLPVRLVSNHSERRKTVRYTLLIYQGSAPTPDDPEAWGRLPEAEQQAVYRDYQA